MQQRKVLVVIIWRPEKQAPSVLALHRNEGFWQSVTGGVDEGEDFPTAALREVREETGLTTVNLWPLGMEQEFIGRWGPAIEQAFVCTVTGGQTPPTVALDGKEHDKAEWLSPQEAMDRVKFPFDREAICRAAFPPEPIFLTKDGEFKQDQQLITHQRTVNFLHHSLTLQKDNSYLVCYGQERLAVAIEDTARFVVAYDQGQITLLDGRQLPLEPETLSITSDNVLYCTVAGERARFLRSAYYEIAKHVREESVAGKTQYTLHCRGRDYRLRIADKS
jgi:8-oxo-dGTP pyrophosphatase MutT (NUDIX family)